MKNLKFHDVEDEHYKMGNKFLKTQMPFKKKWILTYFNSQFDLSHINILLI